MRARLVTAALLLGAALSNLPVVYVLIKTDHASPPIALTFGFLSMGLGWAAGFLIENKRRWFVVLASAVGVLELGALFLPDARDSSAFIIAAAAFAAAALLLLLRTPAPRRA